jgi:EAL domain-containing protein (putative c-di-GMP-specific phosphodiesterase class I)
MNYLKEKRISFSLDDYGSGNANLNYLLEFSFDIAKIDKFVLWNAFQNPQYMETLECTIEMLKKLGVRMVMEGVETEEQKKKLEELQCDYFQGYYFSRPLPDEQFVEYLNTSEYGAAAAG